ncbi:kinase-like domain-containing protein [Massariosphaeria phaeospora]|uniref:Altered inheritance of mitochondria protein 9, mitochondrial n=1 Tax=Massariosphaeria phaeospora TaxID=100035 RepID=A0A7C8IL90_9PLEO|nr:kinase-like domain-containing protein [Massariosphaeria phaeospora]
MLHLHRRVGKAFMNKTQSSVLLTRLVSITCRGKIISQENLFRYTNGRFLVDEENQCRKRNVRFDISSLCELVGNLCETASPVIAIDKLEGGFSKALLMKRADGTELVAKIPCRNAGLPYYTTASEVAVLHYIREHTSIPVPKVLAWSSSSTNPVGAEYIVMDKASGVQAFQIWSDLDGLARLSVIKQMVDIEREMALIRFPAFGHLYHTEHISDYTSTFPLDSFVDSSGKFCIGPSCDRTWHTQVGVSGQDTNINGPYPTGNPRLSPVAEPAQQIKVLETAAKVMEILHTNKRLCDLSIPLLWHTDLHMGNIFLSPGDSAQIVSIIDWQSICVGPAFLQIRWPVFLEPPADYALGFVKPKLPENFDDLDAINQEIANYKFKKANRTKAYETATFLNNKFAHNARNVHEIFKELFVRCDEASQDGIIPLRDCLISISQSWNELGFTGSPPIQFSPEELEAHRKDYDEYQEWHNIQRFAREYLDTDAEGWISPEVDFEKKLQQNRELFELFVKQMANGRTREEIKQAWPFAAAL